MMEKMLQHQINEKKRRQLNTSFDTIPSIHHKFNYNIAKPYVVNKKVLDVGCWTGQFEKLAGEHATSITGIDPGKDAINFAKKNVPNVDFMVGDALKLNFKNYSYDTVVFIEVIEHLPKGSENKALDEINKVLKKGGHLIISTPSKNIFSILFDPAYFIIGHRHYSLAELKCLLNKSGFKIIKTYKTRGFANLTTSFLNLIAKHIFNTKINFPKWVNKIKIKEHYQGGFANIHLIAVKNSDDSKSV